MWRASSILTVVLVLGVGAPVAAKAPTTYRVPTLGVEVICPAGFTATIEPLSARDLERFPGLVFARLKGPQFYLSHRYQRKAPTESLAALVRHRIETSFARVDSQERGTVVGRPATFLRLRHHPATTFGFTTVEAFSLARPDLVLVQSASPLQRSEAAADAAYPAMVAAMASSFRYQD